MQMKECLCRFNCSLCLEAEAEQLCWVSQSNALARPLIRRSFSGSESAPCDMPVPARSRVTGTSWKTWLGCIQLGIISVRPVHRSANKQKMFQMPTDHDFDTKKRYRGIKKNKDREEISRETSSRGAWLAHSPNPRRLMLVNISQGFTGRPRNGSWLQSSRAQWSPLKDKTKAASL